jgi:hydrogenase nickel incorporation protein HypA/HybF
MHEMSIVESMLGIIKDEMARHQVSRLMAVHLVVGELTAVVPEALTFCFELYIKETPLQGARLEIEPQPLSGRCKKCKEEFRIEEMNFRCPQCQNPDVEILTGRELYIKDIEAE